MILYLISSSTESSSSFGVGSGLLIAVPIPPDVGWLGDEIEQAIQQALAETKWVVKPCQLTTVTMVMTIMTLRLTHTYKKCRCNRKGSHSICASKSQ